MKTYEEVIARLAKSMWHNHMGGGTKYHGVMDSFPIVAYIFDVSEETVQQDADAAFRELNGGLN